MVLYFTQNAVLQADLAVLEAPGVKVICIANQGQPAEHVLIDHSGQAHERYGAVDGSAFLVRPDGYLMGCWMAARASDIAAALKPFQIKNERGPMTATKGTA